MTSGKFSKEYAAKKTLRDEIAINAMADAMLAERNKPVAERD